jgi:hypothetical protein
VVQVSGVRSFFGMSKEMTYRYLRTLYIRLDVVENFYAKIKSNLAVLHWQLFHSLASNNILMTLALQSNASPAICSHGFTRSISPHFAHISFEGFFVLFATTRSRSTYDKTLYIQMFSFDPQRMCHQHILNIYMEFHLN